MSERHGLVNFQTTAVEGLVGVVQQVARHIVESPDRRRESALQRGVMLLQSPTGSGKTLMLSRMLEQVKGTLDQPVVWLWFAPYAGLVTQTKSALAEQASGLRVRDITEDREAQGTRDGDVFVQTWATMAANNKDARKVRRTTESQLSVDDLLEEWRSRGFLIGMVIDEAHLNFGASAKVAADFYLNVLRPDFTVLATATPSDAKLEDFEKKAGIEIASRVVIPRADVVDRGLNKLGLKLGIIKFNADDEDLVDHETATLTAAWCQHLRVKEDLEAQGISLTPLMLVQVEDQAKGGEDPVQRVRDKLRAAGVPPGAIREHTSGKPDPEFHTFAYDPEVEVLIFKVAVATGFDAPRAWTLVSVRPNRGKDFGLQIVGRIMRVHPLVRPVHGENTQLDHGYVFLSDPTMQEGLQSAVDEIKAVEESIRLLTDQLDVHEYDSTPPAHVMEAAVTYSFEAPRTVEERQLRLDSLVGRGFVHESVRSLSVERQEAAIKRGEIWSSLAGASLFGADLPTHTAPVRGVTSSPKIDPSKVHYPLRTDLGIPQALCREELPDLAYGQEFLEKVAHTFCRRADVLKLLTKAKTKAQVTLHEMFEEEGVSPDETVEFGVRFSAARIAEKAQSAFQFNDTIDPRALKTALVAELEKLADDEGHEVESKTLRRTIDFAAMREPGTLEDAVREVNSQYKQLKYDIPIESAYHGAPNLPEARLGAYGIFPEQMNNEERAFAEYLDDDRSGLVRWWLRNPESKLWATRIILPNGRRFFPDFAVGINGRSSEDGIVLVEIKDDGSSGRLHSDSNLLKIRTNHDRYGKVVWTYRETKGWAKAEYFSALDKISAMRPLEPDDFRLIL